MRGHLSTKTRAGVMALAATLLAGLFATSAAAAPVGNVVSCEKALGVGPMAVHVDSNPPFPASPRIALVRAGDVIEVTRGSEVPVPCGPGVPRVDEITTITLTSEAPNPQLYVDLRGGPFAPGAGLDIGKPEIEIVGGSGAVLSVRGSDDESNEIHAGELPNGGFGVDLNGDLDGDDIQGGVTESLRISGGALDDVISADGSRPYFIGPRRDGPGPRTIFGEEGDDLLVGSTSNSGSDLLSGGPGEDTLSYAKAPGGVSVSLGEDSPQSTGGGGTDRLGDPESGLPDIENLIGGPHPDSLTGSDLFNVLNAAGDGEQDIVSCEGPDDPADRALGETNVDIVYDDCEQIEWLGLDPVFPEEEGGGGEAGTGADQGSGEGTQGSGSDRPDETREPVTIKVLRTVIPATERGLIKRGVRAKVRCAERCAARVELAFAAGKASRLGIDPVVAVAETTIGAGKSRWVRLRLEDSAATALEILPGNTRPYTVVRAHARQP